MKWLPIRGFEGYYEVSDQGEVRSLPRTITRKNGVKVKVSSRVMKLSQNAQGYLQVKLSRGKESKVRTVHRLVAEHFVPGQKPGLLACHDNGNPLDCRAENLYWGTHSQNGLDMLRHGTSSSRNKTHCPKGHPYSEENTYIWRGDGRRRCRLCIKEQSARKYLTAKGVLHPKGLAGTL